MEGSSVLLLFLSQRDVGECGVDGYYLGSVECEDSKDGFTHYLPKDLFISVEGLEAARMVDGLGNNMLRFCEQAIKSELYNAIKRSPTVRTRREALRLSYQRMDKEKVMVPNPKFLKYKELSAWLNAALHSGRV